MAHEELEHVAILRRERRRAYRAERSAPLELDAGHAEALELRLADQLDRRAGVADAAHAARLRGLAEDARHSAQQLRAQPRLLSRGVPLPGGIPDDPLLLSEMLAERYLEAAEHERDEAVLAAAQGLAGRAVRRLAWLRGDVAGMV
jgi:hypothetical protein